MEDKITVYSVVDDYATFVYRHLTDVIGHIQTCIEDSENDHELEFKITRKEMSESDYENLPFKYRSTTKTN